MPTTQERLATALAGRYRLDRELGHGGMAVVYLAHDVKHDRPVALKLLKPEISGSVGSERFSREIRLAARLQHPHICSVYDSGAVEGTETVDQTGSVPTLLYYVMPFIAGESLRDRLNRETRLPVAEAVRITREAAQALEHAHRHHVVHRDIKPENILLTEDGNTLVADFGIARVEPGSTSGDGSGGVNLTETGFAIGTPRYMSPEQRLGAPVDARSDIYSLSATLYEMLTGEPVESGGNGMDLFLQQMTDAAPRIRLKRPEVSPALEAVVRQGLHPDPEARFPTMQGLSEALEAALDGRHPAGSPRRMPPRTRRRLIIAGSVVLVLALLATAGAMLVPASARATALTLLTRKPATLDRRRIVVAPLENRSGDSTLPAFGAMAADWIAQELMQTGQFQVVDPRTSVTAAAVVSQVPRLLRDNDPAMALAKETGSGLLVSGSYFREGDSLRLQVRLTDVATGQIVRAMSPVSGIVTAPSALVAAVGRRTAAALTATVDTAAGAVAGGAGEPPSYEAYSEVSRGWESFFRGDDEDFYKRLRHAAALDSNYAMPLLLLGWVWSTRNHWEQTDSVLQRVERLESRLTPTERTLRDVLTATVAGDQEGALRSSQQLLELSPGSSEVPLLVASFASSLNRPRIALAALDRTDPARGLNLASPWYWSARMRALHELGDFKAELEAANQAERQFGREALVIEGKVRALAALGRAKEAAAALRLDKSPPSERAAWFRVMVAISGTVELRTHGDSAEAVRFLATALEHLTTLPPDSNVGARQTRALFFIIANRYDEASALVTRLPTDSADITLRGLSGVIAARQGRADEARRQFAWLGQLKRPYMYGENQYWQAHIAALLGDSAEAVGLLRAAVRAGTPIMADGPMPLPFHADPDLESLRGMPAFRELITAR